MNCLACLSLLFVLQLVTAADFNQMTSCLGQLSNQLILPNSPNYTTLSTGQRPRIIGTPLAIMMVNSETDVIQSLECAYAAGIASVVRAGGHSYEGFSSLSNTLIIDISSLDSVNVFQSNGQAFATVQAGARLGNVYRNVWQQGNYSFNAGTCPSVGIGGHISGGGYGMQTRKYGLAADQTVAIKVLLFNGTIINATKDSNADLFWALRGGGSGSFGIILEYTIKLFQMPLNTMFLITYNSSIPDVIDAWQKYFPFAPQEISTQLTVSFKGTTLRGHYMGSQANLQTLLTDSKMLSFPNANVLIRNNCTGLGVRLFLNRDSTCSQFDMLNVPRISSPSTKEYRKSKSDYLSNFLPLNATQMIYNQIMQNSGSWIQFEAYGGAMDEFQPDFSPFPNRNGTLFSVQYTTYLTAGELETSANYKWIRSFEQALKPFVNGQHYQNYPDLDLGDNFGIGYFGEANYQRLQQIKLQYDPLNYFKNPQSIPLPKESNSTENQKSTANPNALLSLGYAIVPALFLL